MGNYIPRFLGGSRGKKPLDEEGESGESSEAEANQSSVMKGISKFETSEASEAGKSDKSKDVKKKNSKKDKSKAEKEEKHKLEKEKKEKKEKEKKEKKEKEKKEKGKKKRSIKHTGAEKLENESDDETRPSITTEKTVKDITNLTGDPGRSSDATSVEVHVGKGDMRGKENMQGPGVSALAAKFGGTGGQKRPISTGEKSPSETPKGGELQEPVHSKKFGYDRLNETPKKSEEPSEGAVASLKSKFGEKNTGTPTSATKKTSPIKSPTKVSGSVHQWQSKKKYSSLKDSGSNSDSDVEQKKTTTTTTTSTPGTRALRDKYNNNSEDKKSGKTGGDTTKSPEKKRRIVDDAGSDENLQKENEKNKSPRRAWSPSSKKTNDGSKDETPRKRKSGLGSFTKGKSHTKSETKTSVAVQRRNFENKHEPMDEKFESLILRRTSALIYGADKDPVSPRPISSTPMRTETNETTALVTKRTRPESSPTELPKSKTSPKDPVSKRTRVDDTPKDLPKTKTEPKETVTKRTRTQVTPREEPKEEINPYMALKNELEKSVKKRRKPEDSPKQSPKQRPKTEHISAQSTTTKSQFEVTKRTKLDDSPKQRPKTEYTKTQRSESPRPRSVANTKELFSTPSSVNGTTPGGTKTPTTKQGMLLRWCQNNTEGYEGVNVTNFTSSWADGLAFCALVHKFYPKAFDFKSLKAVPENKRSNLKLAFDSAEKYAGVPQLLDVQDMMDMGDKPDMKCVFTYMTSLYQGLNRNAK